MVERIIAKQESLRLAVDSTRKKVIVAQKSYLTGDVPDHEAAINIRLAIEPLAQKLQGYVDKPIIIGKSISLIRGGMELTTTMYYDPNNNQLLELSEESGEKYETTDPRKWIFHGPSIVDILEKATTKNAPAS